MDTMIITSATADMCGAGVSVNRGWTSELGTAGVPVGFGASATYAHLKATVDAPATGDVSVRSAAADAQPARTRGRPPRGTLR